MYYVKFYVITNKDKNMPTQKLKNKNVRKLTKVGGLSLSVTIPIEIVKSFGWREKQKVSVKKVKGGVLIKDWKE